MVSEHKLEDSHVRKRLEMASQALAYLNGDSKKKKDTPKDGVHGIHCNAKTADASSLCPMAYDKYIEEGNHHEKFHPLQAVSSCFLRKRVETFTFALLLSRPSNKEREGYTV